MGGDARRRRGPCGLLALVVALCAVLLPAAGPSAAVAPAARTFPTDAPGLSVLDVGGRCDGSSDDQAAVERGIREAASGGTALQITGRCRVSGNLQLDRPVTIEGASRDAALLLDGGGSFQNLFTVSGPQVRVAHLRLERAAPGPGIMINLRAADGLELEDITLDGRKSELPDGDFHGIAISPEPGQEVRDVRLTDSTVTGTDYGLLQDSSVTAPTDGFVVRQSTFTRNHMDDLEFNAPNGRMTDIEVSRCLFTDNLAENPDAPYGFGVGLANVQSATVAGNVFRGYRFNPVHIEDRSADVLVSGNAFADAATAPTSFASHVVVLSGAHHVTVEDNDFDLSANTGTVYAVYLGEGGSGKPVTDVVVTGNRIRAGPASTPVGQFGTSNVRVADNTVLDGAAS